MSGFSSSSRVSATRRFSPPDRLSTAASPGGQRSASIAISSWLSSVQPSTASIFSCSSPISAISASKSSPGRPFAREMALNRSIMSAIGADAVHDILLDRLGGVELRLLLEIADGDPLARPGLAGEFLVAAGHDLHQRRLARAVGPDDADLGVRVELQVDVVEDRLRGAGKGLGQALHHKAVLGGHRVAGFLRMCGIWRAVRGWRAEIHPPRHANLFSIQLDCRVEWPSSGDG